MRIQEGIAVYKVQAGLRNEVPGHTANKKPNERKINKKTARRCRFPMLLRKKTNLNNENKSAWKKRGPSRVDMPKIRITSFLLIGVIPRYRLICYETLYDMIHILPLRSRL